MALCDYVFDFASQVLEAFKNEISEEDGWPW